MMHNGQEIRDFGCDSCPSSPGRLTVYRNATVCSQVVRAMSRPSAIPEIPSVERRSQESPIQIPANPAIPAVYASVSKLSTQTLTSQNISSCSKMDTTSTLPHRCHRRRMGSRSAILHFLSNTQCSHIPSWSHCRHRLQDQLSRTPASG